MTTVTRNHRTARVTLGGVEFDPVSEQEVVHTIVDTAMGGRGGWVCTVNVDVLRQHAASTEVRDIVSSADVTVADGMPLLWASKVAGQPLPERVAGSSLIETLPRYAAKKGARLYFLGGNEGAAADAAARLQAENPGLEIVGTFAPPFGFENDPAQLADIDRRVRAARPHIVFVGLGFPKQERLIARLRSVEPSAWYVSCGVSFSFASGQLRRAPRWVQALGLEWLHRLGQEPRRLYRRYLVKGPPVFARLLVSALLTRRRREAVRVTARSE